MPDKSNYIDLNGLSFHYRDWGGSGRDVLLLHGLSSNARYWDLTAEHLAGELRLLALDQRGHGDSAKSVDGYDFTTFANDIATLVQTLGLAKPIIVGHSWGGNVGIQVAHDYPGLLSGLVCIDGGTLDPSSIPGVSWERIKTELAPPDFEKLGMTLDDLLERFGIRNMDAKRQTIMQEFVQANFEVQADGKVLPSLRRDKHMLIVRALWDQQVSELYPKIACPVLFMPARQPANPPPANSLWAHKDVQITLAMEMTPNARLVWMDDSVHDVPLQRPVEAARVILETASDGFFDS